MINVVLYQPEIAQNTGNIARTCAVLGARLHLVRPLGFQLGNPKFARAAMDYFEGVDCITHDDWTAFVGGVQDNARILAVTPRGQHAYSGFDYRANDFLLFGAESKGIPKTLEQSLPGIHIPMPGGGRSLNLAVSVGIVAFEAVRVVSGNWS